ncbi:nitroreductase family protein [Micromonospora sp. NBC_00421]|uniref:nitroreductase family protein n=1 Tax=Micromonospora sp. NBC_00421 TaxID=2975976 RepID=UPI002E23B843
MSSKVITDIDEVLTTTRAVRRRMDLDRPVGRAVIEECLRLAQQAPMGSNLEDWRIVAVDDPTLKRQLSQLYTEIWDATVAQPLAGGEAATTARLSPSVRADPQAQARQHRATRVREVLGLPDDWRPVTLAPVAYTRGLDFRPAVRADLADVASWNGPTERAGSAA